MHSGANNIILANLKTCKNLQVETPETDDKRARSMFLSLLFVYAMSYTQVGVEEEDGKMGKKGRRIL